MDKEEGSEVSVPVPWGEIRGKVWGPDHGRPVLCLHGWADNCGSFNTLIPLLPKECRYVALDLAGHGLSSHRPPGELYSLLLYVADVRRVADALQLRTFSIISHSMGGDIAGMFSALYPEMVDALVLLDSYGFLPTDSEKDLCRYMRQGMDELLQFEQQPQRDKRVHTYEEAVERLSSANPSMSEQSVHILLERGLLRVDGGFVFSRDIRVNFKNVLRSSLEQVLQMHSRLPAAVLVVLADEGYNRIFTEIAQSEFAPTLLQDLQDRNHKVVTVPGGHHVHLDKPGLVAPFVSDFLRTKKNVLRSSLEQVLQMHSRLPSAVLVVLADEGYNRIFTEIAQSEFAPTLLQDLQDRNHKVVTVPGGHHVHLDKPGLVAPFVSDFLRTKVLSRSNKRQHKL